MKFYDEYYTTYYNGEKVDAYVNMVCADEIPEDRTIKITWDNLNKVYRELGCILPFNVWNFKRGRRISFWHDYKDIKETKQPILNMEVKVTTKECNPSIQEILKYHDGEKAIKYLVERGMSVIASN